MVALEQGEEEDEEEVGGVKRARHPSSRCGRHDCCHYSFPQHRVRGLLRRRMRGGEKNGSCYLIFNLF